VKMANVYAEVEIVGHTGAIAKPKFERKSAF
jgi:hypothetical protein